MKKLKIIQGDNLPVLKTFKNSSFDLIYIDPPFNTGVRQIRKRFKTIGKNKRVDIDTAGYDDKFDNFIDFIKPRVKEAYRILKPNGSFFFHLDYREIHYCKVMIDTIFGRSSFINEIIWSYDYGARSRKRWSAKHDNILWYVKNPNNYTFNYDEIDRIPYMAPSLVGEDKAAQGKTPTDVWWNTIVPTNGKEKTGYATQKPLNILNRIVQVHSNKGDKLLDFFAGSGTFGEAAYMNKRYCTLIDENPEAIRIMKKRFAGFRDIEFI